MKWLAPFGFLASSAAAPFDYVANFGGDMIDFWDAGLGVTVDGSVNTISLLGQSAGIVMGNPDFGAGARPSWIANSANANNLPAVRYQSTVRKLDTPFGFNVASPQCYIQAYYAPSLAANELLLSGPKFGSAVGFYNAYNNGGTTFRIWDGNTADQVVADAPANWVGLHAMILVMNGASSRMYRDGGANLVTSGQTGGGIWNGFTHGDGVFGRPLPVNFEFLEGAAFDAIPSDAAFSTWLSYIGSKYAFATSPI